MKRYAKIWVVIVANLTAMVPHLATADSGTQMRQGRRPPQEAFDACNSKAEGDTVTMTTPRGDTITCSCKQVDGQLAAVPDRMPGQGSGGPPPDQEEGGNHRSTGGNEI